MRVCVVGAGGREHALAHVLGRDADVVVTPGNPGMARAGVAVTAAEATEIDADLFVIGPEAPLVDGLADRLRHRGARVFGPGAQGAHLEGSKAWMKEVLVDAGVPTARYGAFDDAASAYRFLDTLGGLYVIKTDGLAAGKGVLVTESLTEARDAVDRYLSGEAFGAAGRTVVIEEGLVGPELSVLAVCDGQRAVALAPAQDFKRVGDGDTGPNTGGMGAYSPVAAAGPDVVDAIMDRAVDPTLAALRRRGIDYRGVLYAGLMLTPDGPKVIEYNVRFGDPEAQVVLPRLSSDLADLLARAADGALGDGDPRAAPAFVDDAAVTVVCATEGYPIAPRTGDPIEGLDAAAAVDDVTVYYAGVAEGAPAPDAAPDAAPPLVTAGGRVLCVTALGPTVEAARTSAYDAVARVGWSGMHHRTDIAAP
jgi:phosphoribosylamine---glycine ligase